MNSATPPRLLRSGWVTCALLVLSGLGAFAADEAEVRAALETFAGDWTGQVEVRALDGFVLKTVPATRAYAWDDGEQVVKTTLKDGAGDYVIISRQSVRLGRLEARVARPALPEDRYLGAVEGDAIVWTNAEGNRRDARERVSTRGGAAMLETASVEPIRGLGLSGLVRLVGEFRPTGGTAVSDRAPPPGRRAVADVVQVPAAPDGAAQAALASRLEEVERRAALAENRIAQVEAESRSRTDAATTEMDVLRTRIGSLLQERDAAMAQASEREQDATRARQALEETKRSAGASSDELSRLEAGLAGVREARDRAEEQVRTREGEISQLSVQLAAATEAARVAAAERDQLMQQATPLQRDNERLLAATQRIEQERDSLVRRIDELERRLAAPASPPPRAPEAVVDNVPSIAATVRDQLIGEVQQMERRVLELESERNRAREQTELLQRQLEEVRRLRDDTLLRFQTVVAELNAMREEKERLSRANLSLQAEVRSSQTARETAGRESEVRPSPGAASTASAATADGRTADMVVAGLQVIGVTRGEQEDKAILDGRLYRNGDVVEPELGIVFDRIEGNALIFHDRRGREYRRRF